ncbi:MAG TPA: 1-deoxy-D-xylulose-5-phosphate reductoisomerase [Thermoanaerobaculia bacterium]|jgi:1-deoxy-D-xylulose-5-phosphate reductoisomerase|nr:1-deoxy-D-xylulose-5-phosphate reductoisomerase [Thermoanaerobaculia bacterium]
MSLAIAVLGATGSVGSSVLRVVRAHPDRLRVVALAAYGSDPEKLLQQVEELRPALVGVMDEAAAARVARQAPRGVEVVAGEAGLLAVATHPEATRVVAAMVGAAGLRPVWAAVDAGKDLALANKECLVVAGRLLMGLARQRGVRLLPVDSEHAALHQALRGGTAGEVARLVLTASGGPFWRRDAATFESIAPAEALAHPTWRMGAKITVDSATLMNKGLELIEASHLFAVPPQRIEVVIHPQSLVHSLVEFCDGSWLAQLSVNDMVFPVQYALSYPERWDNDFPRLAPGDLGRLDFFPLDEEKFPTVALARRALAAGDSAPAVLNGANEVAVAAFLRGALPFPAIAATVGAVLDEHQPGTVATLDEALAWDAWGRQRAGERLAAAGGDCDTLRRPQREEPGPGGVL